MMFIGRWDLGDQVAQFQAGQAGCLSGAAVSRCAGSGLCGNPPREPWRARPGLGYRVEGRPGSRMEWTRTIGVNARPAFTGTQRPGCPRNPAADMPQAARLLQLPGDVFDSGTGEEQQPFPQRAPLTLGGYLIPDPARQVISRPAAMDGHPAITPRADAATQHQPGQQRPGQPDAHARGASNGRPVRSSWDRRYRSSATSPVPLSPLVSGLGNGCWPGTCACPAARKRVRQPWRGRSESAPVPGLADGCGRARRARRPARTGSGCRTAALRSGSSRFPPCVTTIMGRGVGTGHGGQPVPTPFAIPWSARRAPWRG